MLILLLFRTKCLNYFVKQIKDNLLARSIIVTNAISNTNPILFNKINHISLLFKPMANPSAKVHNLFA